MKDGKIREKSDKRDAAPSVPLDGPAVHGRLAQIIAERAQRDGQRTGSVQRAIARAIRRAGLTWDTVSKKLRGERRMTEADVRGIAAAFGENPEWLATGQGPHGATWIRQHFEALARSRGRSLPSASDRAVATIQRGTSKGRGRLRTAIRLGPRVTGESMRRRRPRWTRDFRDFPNDPDERERRIKWLAGNPDILDVLVGRELSQGPRRTALQWLLDAATRAVESAADGNAAANRRALVRELTNALRRISR